MLKGARFETSNMEVIGGKRLWRMLKTNEEMVWLKFLKFVLVVGCHVGWWRLMKCGIVVVF